MRVRLESIASVELALDLGEHVLGRRDTRRLHPIDQLVALEREHLLRLMLMQPLDAHQFQYRELANARGKIGLGELGVEEVVRQIEFQIHKGARIELSAIAKPMSNQRCGGLVPHLWFL